MLQFLAILLAITQASARVDEYYWQTRQIVDYITRGPEKGRALNFLSELCDDFGPRQTGTQALENAIDFVVETLKNDGFDDVHTEKVDGIPYWVRGDDHVEMTEPRYHKLNILAIEGSPSGYVHAEIVVVRNYGELARMRYSGKIVVIAEPYMGYGRSYMMRRAAKVLEERGAVGVLLNSGTPFSLYTPHTGDGARGSYIPSACITNEEALMLYRMYKRGKRIVIRMNIRSRDMNYKVSSRNTVFEIKGSKHPDEIVLISAHMDSWDVGQGALDDGAGVAAVRSAMYTIKALAERDPKFRPKRTIRAVFWTAEEQGYIGSTAYEKAHKHENFVFASETDQGALRPRERNSTLQFMGDTGKMGYIRSIAEVLRHSQIPLDVEYGESQGDVFSFAQQRGVPSVNYVPDKNGDFYFKFHHSPADYVSVLQDGDLEYTASIFASMVHIVANLDEWA